MPLKHVGSLRQVLVANCQMDTDKIKIYGARVKVMRRKTHMYIYTYINVLLVRHSAQVDSLEAVAEIEQAEKEKMKKKIEKIVEHKCNVWSSIKCARKGSLEGYLESYIDMYMYIYIFLSRFERFS